MVPHYIQLVNPSQPMPLWLTHKIGRVPLSVLRYPLGSLPCAAELQTSGRVPLCQVTPSNLKAPTYALRVGRCYPM